MGTINYSYIVDMCIMYLIQYIINWFVNMLAQLQDGINYKYIMLCTYIIFLMI